MAEAGATTAADAAPRTFEAAASGVRDGASAMHGAAAQIEGKATQTMERAMKTAEEMVQFGQGNVEAWVKSGQILAAGLQDIGKQVAANAQATFDETMSTFKAMTSVRSIKEAFDMQATLTRSAMEKAMAETGRLTEASFKLAEQSAAPLAARFSLVVEKFGNGA
ncbi:MAG: phasin family protein [Acetobacteraceae bacterium]